MPTMRLLRQVPILRRRCADDAWYVLLPGFRCAYERGAPAEQGGVSEADRGREGYNSIRSSTLGGRREMEWIGCLMIDLQEFGIE